MNTGELKWLYFESAGESYIQASISIDGDLWNIPRLLSGFPEEDVKNEILEVIKNRSFLESS